EVPLFALLTVMLLRESLAILTGAPATSLWAVLYLAFNLFLVISIRGMFRDSDQAKVIAWGLLLGCVVASAGVLLLGEQARVDGIGMRSIATFNNPNQLGYFAVCVA